MGLILSKFIPPLIFPLGLAFLLCLLAAWLGFRARAWGAAVAALLAAVLLYAGSSPLVSQRLIRGLEQQYPPQREHPRVAAIVLLGGGMGPGPVYPETNWAGDRVIHAARLWKQGCAPRVVATGGTIPFLTDATGSEAAQYQALLTEVFGVPASAILRVDASRTTVEDAELSARLFDSTGMKKEILLVTSAMHMPRAVALFRKHGFKVHPASTDFYSVNERFKIFQLLPSYQALATTSMALHEYLGTWVYKKTGKL